MNALNRSLIFKRFKKVLEVQYGKEEASRIWEAADSKLAGLRSEYADLDGDSRMMILPAAALYFAKPDALEAMKEYAAQMGGKVARIIHMATSVPGVSYLLWANMPALMRHMSSEEKGYRRRVVSETRTLVGVDILVCPLHEAARCVGAPQVASVVCAMDKAYMTGFKYIDYTRMTTLGAGDACCDYRLRFDPSKK